MFVEDTQLYKFILDSGLVAKADLEVAKKEAEKSKAHLGDVLVSSGKINPDNLRRMQAYVLGIPFVDLKDKKLPFDTISLIPEPIARTHNIVAFKKTETTLEVAMLDVNDLSAIDFIKKKVNLKILPRLTDADSIKEVLVQYQKSLKAEFGDLIQKETASLKMITDTKGEATSEADLKKIAEDLPVVRIVDTLIKHSILQNASDIHIEPMEEQVLVRYRIDGLLYDTYTPPKRAQNAIVSRIKVMAVLDVAEKRLPQDGRIKVRVNEKDIDVRVSIIPSAYGEQVVMRLLDRGGAALLFARHLAQEGNMRQAGPQIVVQVLSNPSPLPLRPCRRAAAPTWSNPAARRRTSTAWWNTPSRTWKWPTGDLRSTRTARWNSPDPRPPSPATGRKVLASTRPGRLARCACCGFRSWAECSASRASVATPTQSNSAAK